MVYRAVLFNLWGTLIETASVQMIYKSILELYGVEVSAEEILKALDALQNSVDPIEWHRRAGDRFQEEWSRAVLERAGIHENSAFLGEKISEHFWDHAELEAYSNIPETLDALRSRGSRPG